MHITGSRGSRAARTVIWGIAASIALALPGAAPAQDPSEIEAVRQVSRDMGDAMVAGDVAKLSRVYADDAQIIAISGKLVTKQDLLRNIGSRKHDLQAYELGPIDVQIFGNYAVAHGGVVERRNWDGKDDSGQFIWMDLLEKRDGRWVVIRSAGAKVK